MCERLRDGVEEALKILGTGFLVHADSDSLREKACVDAVLEVIACGRPGTEMPHFDKYAHEDTNCYGLSLIVELPIPDVPKSHIFAAALVPSAGISVRTTIHLNLTKGSMI